MVNVVHMIRIAHMHLVIYCADDEYCVHGWYCILRHMYVLILHLRTYNYSSLAPDILRSGNVLINVGI